MNLSLQKDTLAFQLSRPSVVAVSIASASLPKTVARCRQFMSSATVDAFMSTSSTRFQYGDMTPKGNPMADAQAFYLMNHAVSLVRKRFHVYEPLGDFRPIMDRYHWMMAPLSVRMFYYLLLICTRESRHAKTGATSLPFSGAQAEHGDAIVSFWAKIQGAGSDGAVARLFDQPPATTLGLYCRFLSDVFYKANFSSSFGGPKWGAIADLLRDYVLGKLSAEMMMDTAFTLAHNTAPIFNKGMLFEDWDHELYKILDIQRSGQIPQYIASKLAVPAGTQPPPMVKNLYTLCHKLMPGEFSGYVDYYLVESLGALKTYPSEKAAQAKLHGIPGSSKVGSALADLKQQHAAASLVTLHPGCQVKVVEYERA
jgi:hypothetical protein